MSNLKRCPSIPRLNFHGNIVVNMRKLYCSQGCANALTLPDMFSIYESSDAALLHDIR